MKGVFVFVASAMAIMASVRQTAAEPGAHALRATLSQSVLSSMDHSTATTIADATHAALDTRFASHRAGGDVPFFEEFNFGYVGAVVAGEVAKGRTALVDAEVASDVQEVIDNPGSDLMEASDIAPPPSASDADQANAVHLACAIKLTYIKSDVLYYKNKVIQGVKMFARLLAMMVHKAGNLVQVLGRAVVGGALRGLKAGVATMIPHQSAPVFETALDAAGTSQFWPKFKKFVKSLATLDHMLQFLDVIYKIIASTFFPGAFTTVKHVLTGASWVLGKLVPGSVSKAQSRCLACLLALPADKQAALVFETGSYRVHPTLCGISTAGTSADWTIDTSKDFDFSGDLRKFATDASSAGHLADVKLAMYVSGRILKAPFQTVSSVATEERRRALKSSFALPAKRLAMAASFVATADAGKIEKYLGKFIHVISDSGRLGRLHARAKTPWQYYVKGWKNDRASTANRNEFVAELRRLKEVSKSLSNIYPEGEDLIDSAPESDAAKYGDDEDEDEEDEHDEIGDEEGHDDIEEEDEDSSESAPTTTSSTSSTRAA